MLQIIIPASELYDETKNEFLTIKETHLSLEHSLVSISKWESKWCKPFLSSEQMSKEESRDYIRCMTLTQKVDPNVYKVIPESAFKKVNDYIKAPMTATTFKRQEGKGSRKDIITSEQIYYWMIGFGIPFECEKWHLNRLLTLIKVCDANSQPKKKMSKGEILRRNRDLNAARRSAMNSKG